MSEPGATPLHPKAHGVRERWRGGVEGVGRDTGEKAGNQEEIQREGENNGLVHREKEARPRSGEPA